MSKNPDHVVLSNKDFPISNSTAEELATDALSGGETLLPEAQPTS